MKKAMTPIAPMFDMNIPGPGICSGMRAWIAGMTANIRPAINACTKPKRVPVPAPARWMRFSKHRSPVHDQTVSRRAIPVGRQSPRERRRQTPDRSQWPHRGRASRSRAGPIRGRGKTLIVLDDVPQVPADRCVVNHRNTVRIALRSDDREEIAPLANHPEIGRDRRSAERGIGHSPSEQF